jgi:hypothetical protein
MYLLRKEAANNCTAAATATIIYSNDRPGDI